MDKETKQVFRILQKYMKHVKEHGGKTFTEEINKGKIEFSPFEKNFLGTVEAQINDR